MEDIRVFFTPYGQEIIEQALNVRCRSAEILNVTIDVEPVSFNRGFYSCDMTFYFLIDLDVYTAPQSHSNGIKGVAVFDKKVILYGSEGSVRTFSSEFASRELDEQNIPGNNLPKCVVQVVDPVVLSARLCDLKNYGEPCRCMPKCVNNRLGGEVSDNSANRGVYVTLGLFTIVQLVRNVALLVPVYDYYTPKKECETTTDNPSEAFRRIKFPTDEFFPPKELDGDCSCNDTDPIE